MATKCRHCSSTSYGIIQVTVADWWRLRGRTPWLNSRMGRQEFIEKLPAAKE